MTISFRDTRPPDYPPDIGSSSGTNGPEPASFPTTLIGDLSAPTAVQFKSGIVDTSGIAASTIWTLATNLRIARFT